MEEEDEDRIFCVILVIEMEKPKDRRVPPLPCQSEDQEFVTRRMRKEQEKKEKIAKGDYIPERLSEEEKECEWWEQYDWNRKEH